MFETEAEEYADNTRIKDKNTYIGFPYESISEVQDFEGNYIDISERIIKTFKDASEFGYNKANEWHYVKEGDLPELYKDVLVVFSQGDYDVKRLTNHNEWVGRGSWCSLTDVIAWKEIVLPKEIKEND